MNTQWLRCVALLVLALAGVAQAQGITYEPKDGPGRAKHLVFLAGDEEYRSEEGLPMLAKILSQRHGFKCTVLFAIGPDGTINPTSATNQPGTEILAQADGIVMLLRFRAWPDEQMKPFVDAVHRGVPIIALRTSTHAFRFPANSTSSYKSWSDKGPDSFGEKVLGEEWVTHWGNNRQGATRGVIEPSSKDDPILRGVDDVFGDTGVYEVYPSADSKIILRGAVLSGMNPTDPPATTMKRRRSDGQEQPMNDPMVPIAWTRVNRNPSGTTNRVFCTTMGSATDLKSEGLRRLVVNAVYWGMRIQIPEMADVTYVDPFEPSNYSMGGYRKGLTPTDFMIKQGGTVRSP